MREPILTLKNNHLPTYGLPPAIEHNPQTMYLGYYQNSQGHQFIFQFDFDTGQAILVCGDADWDKTFPVLNGRVEMILESDEAAWLQLCFNAATGKRPTSEQAHS